MTRISILLLSVLLGSACASDSEEPTDYGSRLVLDGDAVRVLGAHGRSEVEVRYLDESGNPVAGVVEFRISGSGKGAELSVASVGTDATGMARVEVRAATAARFDLIISAADAADVRVEFEVLSDRFGSVEFDVTYVGTREAVLAEVAMFSNVRCGEMSTAAPSPTTIVTVPVGGTGSFEGLEIGLAHALYAFGLDPGGSPVAETCVDVALSSTSETRRIELGDMDETVGGAYDVSQSFDISEAGPPALRELRDLVQKIANDPAGLAVELSAADAESPEWLRSELVSLSRRSTASDYLEAVIDDSHSTDYLSETEALHTRFQDALGQLTFHSILTFGEPVSVELGAEGEQLVQSTEVPYQGLWVSRPENAPGAVRVDRGNLLRVTGYRGHIVLGSVLEWILNGVILPGQPGTPADLYEQVDDIYACGSVDAYTGFETSEWARLTAAVCEQGSLLVKARLETALLTLHEYDEVMLEINAVLTDSDGDRDYDQLSSCSTIARFRSPTSSDEFNGDCDGSRQGDHAGRNHPVWDRLHP